jgi:hypothetical protein
MSTATMQAAIWIIFVIFVLGGIAAFITEAVLKYRQSKRIHRRLFETGYRYSTKDFK